MGLAAAAGDGHGRAGRRGPPSSRSIRRCILVAAAAALRPLALHAARACQGSAVPAAAPTVVGCRGLCRCSEQLNKATGGEAGRARRRHAQRGTERAERRGDGAPSAACYPQHCGTHDARQCNVQQVEGACTPTRTAPAVPGLPAAMPLRTQTLQPAAAAQCCVVHPPGSPPPTALPGFGKPPGCSPPAAPWSEAPAEGGWRRRWGGQRGAMRLPAGMALRDLQARADDTGGPSAAPDSQPSIQAERGVDPAESGQPGPGCEVAPCTACEMC